jgi:hypothetical protein
LSTDQPLGAVTHFLTIGFSFGKSGTMGDEWDETEWLQAAARNPAFAFLSDPEEDIYSLADGEPFRSKSCSA